MNDKSPNSTRWIGCNSCYLLRDHFDFQTQVFVVISQKSLVDVFLLHRLGFQFRTPFRPTDGEKRSQLGLVLTLGLFLGLDLGFGQNLFLDWLGFEPILLLRGAVFENRFGRTLTRDIDLKIWNVFGFTLCNFMWWIRTIRREVSKGS